MKLKSFSTTEEMFYKLKSPPSKWKKIFAKYVLSEGLITRIYREFKNLHCQKKPMTQ
jgi:hypothetical protein